MFVFSLQLTVDGIANSEAEKVRLHKELLPIRQDGVMTKNFAYSFPNMREFKVHTLFTSLLLHRNLWMVLSDILMFIIWTSYFEIFLGNFKEILIYFSVSGIIGNLMSVAINQNQSVLMGSNAGIFGIMGSGLGFLIFNWNNINQQLRNAWAC